MIYAGSSHGTPARVQDISQGGISFLGSQALKRNEVVRCTLNLPGVPVGIPVLMRVRWTRKAQNGYYSGLQFLV